MGACVRRLLVPEVAADACVHRFIVPDRHTARGDSHRELPFDCRALFTSLVDVALESVIAKFRGWAASDDLNEAVLFSEFWGVLQQSSASAGA